MDFAVSPKVEPYHKVTANAERSRSMFQKARRGIKKWGADCSAFSDMDSLQMVGCGCARPSLRMPGEPGLRVWEKHR